MAGEEARRHEPVFRFLKEDCERYVTKSDHGNWHLWDEILLRLESMFGFAFTAVPYRTRGDWLQTLWFHPADTSRSRESWSNQAQLWFERQTESGNIVYGLSVEQPTKEEVQQSGWTSDRDGDRLIELLARDESFRIVVDALVRQRGFQITVDVWGKDECQVGSAEEALSTIEGLAEDQGWGFGLARAMSCAEAVTLGELVHEQIMQTYSFVWPVLLKVLPPGIRDELVEIQRKVVLVGAASQRREQNDPWLAPAKEMLVRTGKVTSWWSFNPDADYVAMVRGSLPSWLYISYGGKITWRGRIQEFVGPGRGAIESPWPDHTLPEERGKTHLPVSEGRNEKPAWMWFLVDKIESLDPPLGINDFEPVGTKYRRPGQSNFAFVYERDGDGSSTTKGGTGNGPPDGDVVASLSNYMLSQGFHFPPDLLATYYLSLQSKPFVILSGLSGTGKTKLAQLFAEFISPPVERGLEEPVEIEWGPDTFTLTVRPYMQKYGQVVIPVDAWDYIPELMPGDKTRVQVRAGDSEESCQLSRYSRPDNPELGYIQLLLRGGVRLWFRDEFEAGDVVEVQRAGSDEDPVYVLSRREVAKRRVMVQQRRVELIPVHPDWTDHRGLLGFHHLLTGTYHATGFVRLLLRAYTDPDDSPHFAVLDEMNLARVEHYFADFLSVVESRRIKADGQLLQAPFSLHDHPRCLLAAGNEALAEGYYDADADHKACAVSCGGCPFSELVDEQHRPGEYVYEEAVRGGFKASYFVPPSLEVPLNVYFTGTVNVDETTFTFSPKVLDRANVIEFGEVDLEGYWKPTQTGAEASLATDEIVSRFTHQFSYPYATGLRREAREIGSLAPYRDQLEDLVRLLEPYHMHFGYRVADEILVYLLNAERLQDQSFSLGDAFDCAVLQKILPRFHGSRARLWRPLVRLLAFCQGNPEAAEEHARAWEERDVAWIERELSDSPRLPRSVAKLRRMLRDLAEEGFTSFT